MLNEMRECIKFFKDAGMEIVAFAMNEQCYDQLKIEVIPPAVHATFEINQVYGRKIIVDRCLTDFQCITEDGWKTQLTRLRI